MEKGEQILPWLFPSSSPGNSGIVSDIGFVPLSLLWCRSVNHNIGAKETKVVFLLLSQ